ncbi:acetate kinase [Tenacibaculum sp. MAR_2009_124]|uniref:acetate/propionate family kinase n=1 Tax=Tenacibaculum sp. MAR_2009_124 TaxID=1250059 RepID=UPI000899228C|nr:acetate kinase [Tenacibaculum sp. MAR_2009_124]SEB65854.1 acetate kinase [Tenacibaculum sp. MAR_2009_124]
MKILVINSGSSSIKYQLFVMPVQQVICSGVIERIGLENSKVRYKTEKESIEEITDIKNHKEGLEKVVKLLLDTKVGVISSTDEIMAVGHRVVHGGSSFTETIEVTQEVKNKIKDLFPLAPLHNPANLEGVNVAEDIFNKAKQIAVFDTSFHQTIPTKAYKYAIPNEFLENENIRLYGFHGTSHKYVSEQAIQYLNKENLKIITIHLGNGCSMTAIKDGRSVDHSLGFGPATGLIMGTRSGDVDHSLIFHLIDSLGYTSEEVNKMLHKESGMYGLTGYSDLRDIEDAADKGDDLCKLALEMNAYRIKKYIGSYLAAMNGLDAIVFTAGIGENSQKMRELICKDMDGLGISLDEKINDQRVSEFTDMSAKDSKVKVLVIPTNEELEIARQSFELLENK